MKLKISLLSLVLLITTLLTLSSCSDRSLRQGYGEIVVKLPTADSRGWVNSDVSAKVDTYEVLIFNDTEKISSGLITTVEVSAIQVPVGTYDVIVLAGVINGNTCLIAAGEALDQVVIENARTMVDVELNTFTVDTVWPAETSVPAGSTATVTTSITMPLSSVKADTSSSVKMVDGSNKTNMIGTWTDNVWTGSAEITYPSLEETKNYSIELFYPDIRINSPKYNINSLTNLFGSNSTSWDLATVGTLGMSISPDFKSPAYTTTIDPTSMGFNITWGADATP